MYFADLDIGLTCMEKKKEKTVDSFSQLQGITDTD